MQPFATVRARSLWPCLYGSSAKGLSFGAFPRGIASFRVAGVALFDIPTLYTLHCTLHTLHVTLYTPHFPLSTPHSTLCTPHLTLYTLHFPLHTPHFTLHTPPTLYTFHSTLHIFYSTLYALHSTLYTPILFSHNYDSGVRYPTCGHSGSWASSCFNITSPTLSDTLIEISICQSILHVIRNFSFCHSI